MFAKYMPDAGENSVHSGKLQNIPGWNIVHSKGLYLYVTRIYLFIHLLFVKGS